MKQFFFLVLLIICTTGSAYAEESFLLDSSSDGSATNELNTFLLQQFAQQAEEIETSREQRYLNLLNKYPDLRIPVQQSFPSSAHLHQTFDRSFANTIFFAPASSYITDVQEEKLQYILETMNEETGFHLVIVGHSSFNTQIEELDQRAQFNLWLSGRRAVQVWDFFVSNGINETRLAAFAKGSEEPLNGEETAGEINVNRRVELRLTNQPIQIGGKSASSSQRNTQQRNQLN